jgi:hypothetical protein
VHLTHSYLQDTTRISKTLRLRILYVLFAVCLKQNFIVCSLERLWKLFVVGHLVGTLPQFTHELRVISRMALRLVTQSESHFEFILKLSLQWDSACPKTRLHMPMLHSQGKNIGNKFLKIMSLLGCREWNNDVNTWIESKATMKMRYAYMIIMMPT